MDSDYQVIASQAMLDHPQFSNRYCFIVCSKAVRFTSIQFSYTLLYHLIDDNRSLQLSRMSSHLNGMSSLNSYINSRIRSAMLKHSRPNHYRNRGASMVQWWPPPDRGVVSTNPDKTTVKTLISTWPLLMPMGFIGIEVSKAIKLLSNAIGTYYAIQLK